MVTNLSDDVELDDMLTGALKTEFSRLGNVRIVDTNDAQAVLKGVIRKVTLTPISYKAPDVISRYRAEVFVDVELTSSETNEVLLRFRGLSRRYEYSVLEGYGHEVSALEHQRLLALKTLTAYIARDIFDLITANF